MRYHKKRAEALREMRYDEMSSEEVRHGETRLRSEILDSITVTDSY